MDGCFGGMSIITHDYLKFIHKRYDISKLLNVVLNRYNRMSFERVIGCLLQYMDSLNTKDVQIKNSGLTRIQMLYSATYLNTVLG